MKKTLKIIAFIVGMILVFLIYVQFTYHKKFEVPVTGIRSTTDSLVIARGKYLVMGPSHCFACHTNDSLKALKLNEPMVGGKVYPTPFGNFNVPNITSDKETGIGNISDEELARAIRYNLNHNDEAMVGFMSYNSMSDDDITAIVSYLRTTKPVKHVVEEHDLNLVGKVLMRFMLKPNLESAISTLKPDTTIEYGKHLAFTVAQCNGCHTQRDNVGQLIGEPMAGGSVWDLDDAVYTAPNLTPDDSTGHITHWNEATFIQRFRGGRVFDHSPMPWEGYERMTDNDLKALYRFFNSLPAAKNNIGKTYVKK